MIHLGDFCPYWSYPPTGGGPIRVYNFNKAISKNIKVEQHSFRPNINNKLSLHNIFYNNCIKINENYSEIQHFNPAVLLSSYLLYKIKSPHDTLISKALEISTKLKLDFDILQVEHPWIFNYLQRKNKLNLPIVLVAHNFEFKFMEDRMSEKPIKKQWLNYIKKVEMDAIENSDAVFSVSPVDISYFIDEGIDKNKIYLMPNGVDTTKYNITPKAVKEKIKIKYGYDGKKIIFFSGSIHLPNIKAVKIIEQLSNNVGNDIIFLVIGKAGEGFKSKKNFICTGFVDELMDYIKMADIAINPLISGSGTNLKMLEYFAAGVPTITTPIGARGIDIVNKKHAIICEIENFKENILTLLQDEKLAQNLVINSRRLVEEKYDWDVIGGNALNIYKKILDR